MEFNSSPSDHLTIQLESGEECSSSDLHQSTLKVGAGIVIEELELPASPTIDSPSASLQPSIGEGWKVFATTFVTILLAELGDKTQVATLLMSAEFHAPGIVFAGAAAALIATSLLGVLVGRWLACFLSPRTLDIAAGILLALISGWLLWDVLI